jgi:hypothetical protein
MTATEPTVQPNQLSPVPHVRPGAIPPPHPGRYRQRYGLRRAEGLLPVQPTEPPPPGSPCGPGHPPAFAADARAAIIPVTPAHAVAMEETAPPGITAASETVTAAPAADQVAPPAYPWTAPGVRAGQSGPSEYCYPQAQQNTSNGFSIAAIVLGGIALFIFPPVFGIAGIVMAAIGKSKNEKLSTAALIVSVCGLVIGMAFGMYIATHS